MFFTPPEGRRKFLGTGYGPDRGRLWYFRDFGAGYGIGPAMVIRPRSGLGPGPGMIIRTGSGSGCGIGSRRRRKFLAFWVSRMLEILKENAILDSEITIFSACGGHYSELF